MIQSKTFPNFGAASILALLLAGCSSSSAIPSASGLNPVTPATPTTPSVPTTPNTPDPPAPPQPPAQLTMRTLPSGHVIDFTPHAGLESMGMSFQGEGSLNAAPVPPSGYKFDNLTPYSLSDAVIDLSRSNAGSHSTSVCVRCIGLGMGRANFVVVVTGGAETSLNYSTYGVWANYDFIFPRHVQGVFAGGIPTAAGDRPASGSATYLGKATGFAAFAGGGGNFSWDGNVSLAADFSANTISGWVSGITATRVIEYLTPAAAVTGSVNDIRLSGGTISGTSFTGAAAAIDLPPGSPGINISGSSGSFGGAFYGPGAAEAAGSLALTGPSVNVIASFGAAK